VTGGPRAIHVLDAGTRRYRDGEVFAGKVAVTAPFAVEVDLSGL